MNRSVMTFPSYLCNSKNLIKIKALPIVTNSGHGDRFLGAKTEEEMIMAAQASKAMNESSDRENTINKEPDLSV